MGMSRKGALKRLTGLLPQVRRHADKVRADPDSDAADHWRHEARVWLNDMEAVLRHVGDKTAAEWQQTIDELRAVFGEGRDG